MHSISLEPAQIDFVYAGNTTKPRTIDHEKNARRLGFHLQRLMFGPVPHLWALNCIILRKVGAVQTGMVDRSVLLVF